MLVIPMLSMEHLMCYKNQQFGNIQMSKIYIEEICTQVTLGSFLLPVCLTLHVFVSAG